MSLDSRAALDQAIYEALIASAALQALIGNPARVYTVGGVPSSLWPGDASDFPDYVVTGLTDGGIGQIETKTEDGMEGFTEITVWSTAHSTLPAKRIQEVLVDTIKTPNLTMPSGHNLVLIFPAHLDTFVDESWDAHVIKGVTRFRYMAERGP